MKRKVSMYLESWGLNWPRPSDHIDNNHCRVRLNWRSMNTLYPYNHNVHKFSCLVDKLQVNFANNIPRCLLITMAKVTFVFRRHKQSLHQRRTNVLSRATTRPFFGYT
jgi:hypothetical protein